MLIVEGAMKPEAATPSFFRRACRRACKRWLLVVVLASSACPRSALACKIKPDPDPFPIDTASSDAAPAPSLTSVTVKRAQHAPPGNGDCAEVGRLTLQFSRADGSALPDSVGIRLTVAQGRLPQAFTIPTYPLLTTQGLLAFAGGDDPSQPIDFTLQATGVGAGGAESAPIDIHVNDPGQSSGCAMARRAGRPDIIPLAGFALCWLAFARARRRS